MEVKIKLTAQEYKALFNTIKLMPLNTVNASLQDKAINEIIHKLFMKMAPKMFDLKPKHTIKLSMSEAWALYNTLQKLLQSLPSYEAIVCQDIIFSIHQTTI